MPTLNATAGSSTANSYLTVAEANTYFGGRLFAEMWEDSDDQSAALIWATRMIDRLLSGYVEYLAQTNTHVAQRHVYPQWTGLPATTTQKLAWPRTGMFDRNGNAIAIDVVPDDLKEAVAELAGQLSKSDRTLDNDVSAGGITSVKAGSVSVSFSSDIRLSKVLPEAVKMLLVPSWLTDDSVVPVLSAEVELL